MDKKIYDKNGVRYYYSSQNIYRRCEINDIDIHDGVKKVEFCLPYGVNGNAAFNLIKVNKQFEDVKTIVINKDVVSINISNFMFPNVTEVVCEGNRFAGNEMLCMKNYGGELTLLNTFCKPEDYVVDMKNIYSIDDFALEGCRAVKFINADKFRINTFLKKQFKGSMFALCPQRFYEDSIITLGRNLIGVDHDAEKIVIHQNIANIDVNVNLKDINKIAVTSIKTIRSLGHLLDSKEIILETPERINFETISFGSANIILPSDNKFYKSNDGLVYTKDGKSLISCPNRKSGVVNISNGTLRINNSAFFNCPYVTEVNIPDSVEYIGIKAFYDCKSIKKIEFENGVKTISSKAFAACSFSKIDIPSSIKVIRDGAFSYNNSLSSVILHEGLEEIGPETFTGCKELKEISIPGSVEIVGEKAFPISVTDIYVKENYPQDLILSLMDSDFAINENICIHIENYGNVYIPKDISQEDINFINCQFNLRQIDKDFTDNLYKYARTPENKQNAAIFVYKHTHNEETGTYLRRTGKTIATRLIKKHNEDILISFVSFGLMTANALSSILKLTNKENMTSASAYILSELNKEETSKTSFKL